MASDGRTAGSIFIRVRPDVDGFRKETQDKLGRKPMEVDLEVDVDTKPVDKAMDNLENESKKKKLSISYEVDRSSLNKAKKQIDKAIKDLGLENMSINLDAESLKNARKKIDEELSTPDGRQVSIEYTEDEEGKRKIIRALEDIQDQAREVKVGKWDTDAESLDRALKGLNASLEVPLTIDYDDMDSFDQAISEIDRRLSQLRAVEIPVKLNEEALREMRDTLSYEKEFYSEPILIDVAYNPNSRESIDSAIAAIDSQLASLKEIPIEVELNASSLAEAKAQMEAFRKEIEPDDIELEINVADTGSMRAAIARLSGELATLDSAKVRVSPDRTSIVSTIAEINAALGRRFQAQVEVVGTGFAATEARLQALSRDRVVELRAKLTGRAMRLLEGGFKSLAGINDVEEMVRAFENLIVNFDMIATQAGLMGTAIGTAVNVGTFAVGGLLTVLADAGRVIGLLAAAPTALLAAGAVLQTHNAIWSDFSAALMGIPGVLEGMPPNAQKAVKAIESLNEVTNKAVQDGFWAKMTDEISRFADTVAPTLARGMERTAEVYGDALSGMLDLATAWVNNGDLGAGFANINKGLESVGDATVKVFDAFMTLGLQGSSMFPRLGYEINRVADQFNNWIQAAAAAGDIQRWIQGGIDALEMLGRSGVATVSMLSSLTSAFRQAGMGGLPEFTQGLERAAEVMRSPVWQTKMSTIFEGATEGARETFRGFQRIAEVVYDLDKETGLLLLTIGEVAKEAQFLIADVLERPVAQQGLQDFFVGIRDMLEVLRPAAQSLGDILGTLGTLAGEILREMAPGINTLMGIFSDAANALRDNLVAAVAPLTTFIDNLGHATRIIQGQLLPVANGILQAFNALPAPLQNMIALLLVTGGYMRAIGTAVTTAFAAGRFAGATAGLTSIQGAARNAGSAIRSLGAYIAALSFMGMQRRGSDAFVAVGRSAETASRNMRTAMSGAFTGIATAARGFGSVLLGALGGPVGIAIMAVVTGVAMIASRFGEAKAEAEAFKNEVRALRDQMIEGNEEQIRLDTYDRLEETLRKINDVGGKTEGILDAIVSGRDVSGMAGDYDTVAEALREAENAGHGLGGILRKINGDGDLQLRPEQAAAFERLGITWDNAREKGAGYFKAISEGLNSEARLHGEANAARRRMREEEASAGEAAARTGAEARKSYAELGAEFATTSESAQNFAQAIQTVADSSQSADARVAALGQALQLLSGETPKPAEAGIEAWDNMTAAMSTAESMVTANGKVIGDTTGGISSDYEDMSERQKLALQGVAQVHDSAMAQAISAYDGAIAAGKTHEEAIKAGKSAYEDAGSQINDFANAMGGSATEIQNVKGEYDNLANSEDIELALSMTGMDQNTLEYTYDAMTRIQAAGLEISNTDYVAFLAANPDQALLQVHDLEVVLANFEAKEYMTELLGDNSPALADIAEAVGAGDAYADGSYDAVLKAILETDDIEAGVDALYEWDQAQPEANFKTRDEASEFIDSIMPKLDEYEGEYAAELIENGGATIETTLESLNTVLTEIAKAWGIDLDADDKATPKTDDLLAKLTKFNEPVNVDLDANDKASPKMSDIGVKLDALGAVETDLTIDATDNATPQVGPLGATLGSITATPWTATLDANDGISGPAQNAKGAVESVPSSKNTGLTASGNVISFAQTAIGTIGSVIGKNVNLGAVGNVISFAQDAIGRISGINPKVVALTAVGNVISFAQEAIGKIAGVLPKTVSINTIGNAISNLSTILGMLRNVVSKTITITAKRIGSFLGFGGSDNSADGNLYSTVSPGRTVKKAFANGGMHEDHTAKIYKPSTTYRIFAEPETGGEAYIPLASSKRARSTAIWKETGRRLGVYADGGIEGANGNANRRPENVIYQTVNYPIAESTTKASKRALDMVGIRA